MNQKELFNFKVEHCDENGRIVQIIKDELIQYFVPPIVDVGCGLGDIAYMALEGLDTTLVDINPISMYDYPCREGHLRLCQDFFDYRPTDKIGTLFISHTMQYLDDNLEQLNQKIDKLDSLYIIIVWNQNKGQLGEILHWVQKNYLRANPEVKVSGFPNGYDLIKELTFSTSIISGYGDFWTLAEQIKYMMLIPEGEDLGPLVKYLSNKLSDTEIQFEEKIQVFKKHGK